MTKTAFRSDFLRGLGSALIELHSCTDPAKYYEIILYGCLNNTTYDMQCEGDRGRYLYQAAKLSGDEKAIEEAVRQKFLRTTNETWLLDQLTSILYHFAVDGNEDAGNALYQKYETMLLELSRKHKFTQICHKRDAFEVICIWLTSLDGWSVFKKILNDISEFLLTKNADFYFSDWFIANSEDKFGKKRVRQYLQKQSEKSPHVRAYYEKVQELDNRIWGERPIPTLADVLEAAKNQYSARGLGMQFARKASPEDLEKLANAAMNEPDAGIQVELLWAFRRDKKYVFPEEFLSKLRKSDNKQLRCLAYDIIGQNPSDKTRKLARSLIQSGQDIENGIFLLTKNLLLEDEKLLYDAVKSFRPRRNEGAWHGVYMCARDGVEAMRGKPHTDILEYLYRNTLCGFCREYIVRAMHKKGVLTSEILSGCGFDANVDIRTFAERVTRHYSKTTPK